jgi:hypothetical protein
MQVVVLLMVAEQRHLAGACGAVLNHDRLLGERCLQNGGRKALQECQKVSRTSGGDVPKL